MEHLIIVAGDRCGSLIKPKGAETLWPLTVSPHKFLLPHSQTADAGGGLLGMLTALVTAVNTPYAPVR